MDAEAFVVVAADSDQARSAMKAYFAELDERFVDGFDVDRAFDDDAGIFDPPTGSFVVTSKKPPANSAMQPLFSIPTPFSLRRYRCTRAPDM